MLNLFPILLPQGSHTRDISQIFSSQTKEGKHLERRRILSFIPSLSHMLFLPKSHPLSPYEDHQHRTETSPPTLSSATDRQSQTIQNKKMIHRLYLRNQHSGVRQVDHPLAQLLLTDNHQHPSAQQVLIANDQSVLNQTI